MGFTTLSKQWLESPEQVKAYWQSVGHTPDETELMALGRCGCVRLILKARVYEVSSTWAPANEDCVITEVKSGGPPARLPFAEQADTTLAAVEDLLNRAQAISEIRAEDGRGLAHKSRAKLDALSAQLASLLTATSPPATGQADADLALLDHFLAFGARLHGGV